VSNIHFGEQQDFAREVGGCRILQWKGITILQLAEKEFTLPDTLEVDYVVVGRNSIKSLKALSSVKFRSLILDSSNSFYFAERIMKEAQSFSVTVHSVVHSGAFIAKRSIK
jgi:competence protein ComEC